MSQSSLVAFLRREAIGPAQETVINAIGVYAAALKRLEQMCADPHANLKLCVEDGDHATSLEEALDQARSIGSLLPQLRGRKPLSDRQAAAIIWGDD